MRILITAGNTQTPIDAVRCVTNIFTGRTGARIAAEASARGHAVTLLTSHPETVAGVPGIAVKPYRTFDDLQAMLADLVPTGDFDAIVHSAAVSDYALAGTFAGGPDGSSASAGKISSRHAELWMRFVPTPKLVDLVRSDWHFRGILVKFKLEVGIGDDELIAIARKSRAASDADLIVANTLEGYGSEAFLIDRDDFVERVSRADLSERSLTKIERIFSTTYRLEEVK